MLLRSYRFVRFFACLLDQVIGLHRDRAHAVVHFLYGLHSRQSSTPGEPTAHAFHQYQLTGCDASITRSDIQR